METNITPIEAIKQILKICQSDDVFIEQFEDIENICTQAQALQAKEGDVDNGRA